MWINGCIIQTVEEPGNHLRFVLGYLFLWGAGERKNDVSVSSTCFLHRYGNQLLFAFAECTSVAAGRELQRECGSEGRNRELRCCCGFTRSTDSNDRKLSELNKSRLEEIRRVCI